MSCIFRAVVVIIHEKTNETWTRLIWERLKVRGGLQKNTIAYGSSPTTSLCTPPQEATGRDKGIYSRVRIVHHWNYFKTLDYTVAVLDTYPYGGCLSTLDGLAHGVPVISLPSNFVRGRFTLALYRQMDFMECVASSVEEYLQIALHLASDSRHRAGVVERLVISFSRLTHHEEAASEWERMLLRLGKSMDLIYDEPQSI